MAAARRGRSSKRDQREETEALTAVIHTLHGLAEELGWPRARPPTVPRYGRIAAELAAISLEPRQPDHEHPTILLLTASAASFGAGPYYAKNPFFAAIVRGRDRTRWDSRALCPPRALKDGSGRRCPACGPAPGRRFRAGPGRPAPRLGHGAPHPQVRRCRGRTTAPCGSSISGSSSMGTLRELIRWGSLLVRAAGRPVPGILNSRRGC